MCNPTYKSNYQISKYSVSKINIKKKLKFSPSCKLNSTYFYYFCNKYNIYIYILYCVKNVLIRHLQKYFLNCLVSVRMLNIVKHEFDVYRLS